MGSTNGTQAARRRIEFGVWSSDPDLVRHNYEYLLSLLTFSEPLGARPSDPSPSWCRRSGTTTPSVSTSPSITTWLRCPDLAPRRDRTEVCSSGGD
jgi:hypothetical protein